MRDLQAFLLFESGTWSAPARAGSHMEAELLSARAWARTAQPPESKRTAAPDTRASTRPVTARPLEFALFSLRPLHGQFIRRARQRAPDSDGTAPHLRHTLAPAAPLRRADPCP